ncbi:piggyBac transposable element-derived protein 4-like [Metopolophium dirhodum]|uniref:piggyBac transposable element-derived protein 4-like n=1 Tax=Metopolophium dirhodum TaxID=44670 RepID=UPI00298F43B8|nr:piggyBac transposable element-derived protein 4-like [Metopolophium dirhodum]
MRMGNNNPYHIVFQTNLYATQIGKPFTPTYDGEIRVFIGLNMCMSVKRLPSYRDYWSSAPDLHDEYISSMMSVKRFSWLLSHIHFNDNQLLPKRGEANYDKLYKIRPLLDYIGQNFFNSYRPHRDVAVDEAMVKFKGRSTLKQYMKDKPVKRGYKVWMLCDSSGYNLKFEVYTGKKEGTVEAGLGGRVVLDLCKELENKNHVVYMDNFFSNNQLQRGEYDWATSNKGLAFYKWKDRKTVHILSSLHSPDDKVFVNRKEKDGSTSKVPCPLALKDYNSNMNFVDNFDRLKKDYQCDRKSHKWYMRLFFHFIDCCVVNSFIIYKELDTEGKKLTNKNFRREVYTGLLSRKLVDVQSPSTVKKRTKSNIEISNHKPHVSKHLRLTESKHQPTEGSSRRCAMCSTKKKPQRTKWICSTCKVPLCIKKEKTCFQDYHTK